MYREEYRGKDKIAAAVREGKDLRGKEQDQFVRIENNEDLPPLVLRQPNRFSYMISRDGMSAGFVDYSGN
jgi:beta-1,4-mannosyl-glycoprotein beta-1,4-N-acetylglucosaminyltransferase